MSSKCDIHLKDKEEDDDNDDDDDDDEEEEEARRVGHVFERGTIPSPRMTRNVRAHSCASRMGDPRPRIHHHNTNPRVRNCVM